MSAFWKCPPEKLEELLKKERDLYIEMSQYYMLRGSCPAETMINKMKLQREWDALQYELHNGTPSPEELEKKGAYDLPKFTEDDYIPYKRSPRDFEVDDSIDDVDGGLEVENLKKV